VPTSQEQPFDSEWERVHNRITTYSAEVQRIADMAGLPVCGVILDLACGTGKHLIELAKHGHQCVGIDKLDWKIDKAIEISRSNATEIDFACADLRTYVATRKFDLVFCFYAMSTMRTDDDVMAAFNTAKNALAKNGAFVFNVINREANDDPRSPVHKPARVTHYLRDFTLEEIRDFLSRADFRIRETRFSDVAGVKNLDLHVCAVLENDDHAE
jgi:SAM-dependent methyltransferase